VIITILFLWLIHGFFAPIFWAVVLGIVFYPLYKKILKITKNRASVSSILTIFLILAFIFTPIYFVSRAVTFEAKDFYDNFSKSENQISKYSAVVESKLSALGIETNDIEKKTIGFFKKVVFSIKDQAASIAQNTINSILMFFLMLYLLFFVFKDGQKLLKKISFVLPLGNKKEILLFEKFVSIVRAIFKGTLVVALVQGVVGGILLYFVGVESVFLWTIVMILLSIIPAVGPVFVLAPIAVFFFIGGNIFSAVVVLVGALGISLIDNFLRPVLVGRDLKMHDVFITVSIFGGLSIFGILGLIIGPILAGMFILVWDFFQDEYRDELTND